MRWITMTVALACLLGCAKEASDSTPTTQESKKEAPATTPVEQPAAFDFAKFAADYETEVLEPEVPETMRSGSKEKPFTPIYPRGNLRAGDLDEFRIDVTEDFDPAGKLEFRIGSKVLYSAAFEPDSFVITAPIPDAVREAAKVGKTVKWGYYPEDGKAVTATFKFVREPVGVTRKVKKVMDDLGGNDTWYSRQVKSQLYLKSKLYYAAWREANKIVNVREAKPHALAVMQRSLRGMKLHKSALWEACQEKAGNYFTQRGKFNPRKGPRPSGAAGRFNR